LRHTSTALARRRRSGVELLPQPLQIIQGPAAPSITARLEGEEVLDTHAPVRADPVEGNVTGLEQPVNRTGFAGGWLG
jgi:hypothetical protein